MIEVHRLHLTDITPATIRAWALRNGHDVSPNGRLRPDVRAAYTAHITGPT